MATFLRNQRKKSEPTVKPVVHGSANVEPQGSSKTPDVQNKIIREDKEENNTTEYEYMRSMFVNLMSTMPVTPVTRRPNRIGKQPQDSVACRLIVAANNANLKFSTNFNKGDSAGCASTYQKGALMEARPNGIIFGRKLIESFWSSVHSGKPGPIRYSNVRMRVVDEDTVTFASDWTFNNMRGIIMLETWRRMPDGTFELDEDRFKIEEVYVKPKTASPEEEVLGLQPLYAINEVMDALAKRIDMFTNGDVEGFVNSYTPDALQTADPLANSKGRDNIRKVAGFYINNRKNYGNGRLTYSNFNVKVIDCRTVHVSGDWDLGGRGNEGSLFGYMNVQRYVKQPDGKWLLELDDWTVEPTEFLY